MTFEKLEDIALVTPGTSPKGELINSSGLGLPFFQGSKEFTEFYPSPERYTEHPVKVARTGDVLISVRAPVGEVNIAREDCAIGRGVMSVRAKKQSEQLFIFYFLKSLQGKWDSLGSTGSVFENLSTVALNRVAIPDGLRREAIGEILFNIDQKIASNKALSKSLEEITQTFFKSWFIDFDPVKAKMAGGKPVGMDDETAALFPDSMEESELGFIPKGWKVSKFGDVNHLLMGQSPPGETYNSARKGLPFYQGRTDFGFRFPSKRIFCTKENRVASAGETLVSVRAPVGDVNQAIERCIIGRGVASVLHKSGSTAYTFSLLKSLYQRLAQYNGEGTVFGAINRSDFHNMLIIEPSTSLIKRFEDIFGPQNDNIRTLFLSNETLTEIRNSLLPRLISGELQIPDKMLAS
jgi:type I restriction enzyme S subunit